jgi:peroxiredoxin
MNKRHSMVVCAVALCVVWLALPSGSSALGPGEAEPRGWLGVQLEEDAAEVSAVIPGSPADGSLQKGDTILKVSGRDVESLTSLRDVLTGHAPGDRVQVVVRRGDSSRTFDIELGAVPSPADLTEARLKGREMPAFSVQLLETPDDTDASTISSESLKGTLTLIEFWATWCPPCEQTRAFLTDLKEAHGASLQILAVSPESTEMIQRVAAREKMPYLVGRDEGGTAQKAFGVGQLPTVVAVGEDGTVLDVFVGADHREAIRDLVERHLSESVSR